MAKETGLYVYEVLEDIWLAEIPKRCFEGDQLEVPFPIKNSRLRQISGPGVTERQKKPEVDKPIVLNTKK